MRTTPVLFLLLAVFSTDVRAASIGVPENVAPWGLSPTDPLGHRGIYADLADAVAQRAKSPLEIRFVPYGRLPEGVRSGEFDYAFGAVAPVAEAAAPFVTIIAKVPMMAVARRGLSLTSVADLHSFGEVGYLRGGSCGALIDDDPAIHRVGQDSYELAIRKLAVGRLDAWCSIKPGLIYALDKSGAANQLGERIEYGEVKIGLQITRAKLNTDEAKQVESIVADLLTDGTVGQIFSRYVGTPYAP